MKHNINVRQGESEFTLTQNPSIISSSRNGAVYKFATSSYFEPYITTVGLYDNNRELLAVGKLGKTCANL